MAHLHAARPEPMNASPTHPKVKVTLKLPPSPHSSSGPPLFVAGEAVTGKLEVECKTEEALGLSVIGVEVFGVQELTSRDHSALSPFLHTRRLFQGPGLPPSNAVKPFPPQNAPPLPPSYHHARRGTSTFLFRIPIPRSSPASINLGGGIAKVRYEVRAWVGVWWKGERREVVGRKEVDVVESWDEEEQDGGGFDCGDGVGGLGGEREEVVVAENGKLWMQAKVLGGVLVAGESACVEVQVKNHSAKRNTGLSISLKQALHLPTPPSSPSLSAILKPTTKPPIEISDTLRTIHFRGPEYVVPPGVEGVASLVFDVPRYARSVRGGTREGPEVVLAPGAGGGGHGFSERAGREGRGVEALFEVRCVVGVKMCMGIGTKDITLSIPVRVVNPAALPEIELAPEDMALAMGYPQAPLSPGPPGVPVQHWQDAYNGTHPPGYAHAHAYPYPHTHPQPHPSASLHPGSPLPGYPLPHPHSAHPAHPMSPPLPAGIPLPLSPPPSTGPAPTAGPAPAPAPGVPFVENGYVWFPPVVQPQYMALAAQYAPNAGVYAASGVHALEAGSGAGGSGEYGYGHPLSHSHSHPHEHEHKQVQEEQQQLELAQPQPGRVIEPRTPTRLEDSVKSGGERREERETAVQYHDTPPRPSSAGARSVLPVALDYSPSLPNHAHLYHKQAHADAGTPTGAVFPGTECSPGTGTGVGMEGENRASRLSRKLHEGRKGRSVSPQRGGGGDLFLDGMNADMGPPSTSRINAANSISPSEKRRRVQTLVVPISSPYSLHQPGTQSTEHHSASHQQDLPASPLSPAHAHSQSSKLISPRPLLSPKQSFTIDPVTKRETSRSEKVEELERMADAYPLNEEIPSSTSAALEADPNKTLPGPPVPTRILGPGKDGKEAKQRVRVDEYFDLPKSTADQGLEMDLGPEPDQPPTPTLMAVKKRSRVPKDTATSTGAHNVASTSHVASNGLLATPSTDSSTVTNMLAPVRGDEGGLSGLDALERRLMRDVGTKKPEVARKRDVRDVLGALHTAGDHSNPSDSRVDPALSDPAPVSSTGPPSPLPDDESAISSLTLAGSGDRSGTREELVVEVEVDDEDDGKTQKGGSRSKDKVKLDALSTTAITVNASSPPALASPHVDAASSALETDAQPQRSRKKREHVSGQRSSTGSGSGHKEQLRTKKAAAKGRVAEWLGGVQACGIDESDGAEEVVKPPRGDLDPAHVDVGATRGRSRSREPIAQTTKSEDVLLAIHAEAVKPREEEEKDIKDLLREEDERLGLLPTSASDLPTDARTTTPDPRSSGFVPIGTINKNIHTPGSILLGTKAAPAGSFLVRGTVNGSMVLRGVPTVKGADGAGAVGGGNGVTSMGMIGNGSIVVRGPGGSTRIFRVTDPRSEARRVAEIWARRVEEVEEKGKEKPRVGKGKPTTAVIGAAWRDERGTAAMSVKQEEFRDLTSPAPQREVPASSPPARPFSVAQSSKPTSPEPKAKLGSHLPSASAPVDVKTSKPVVSHAALGVARFPKPAVPTSARLTKPLGSSDRFSAGSPPQAGAVPPKVRIESKVTMATTSPDRDITSASPPNGKSISPPPAAAALAHKASATPARSSPARPSSSSSPPTQPTTPASTALLKPDGPSYDVRSARGGRGGKVTAVSKVFAGEGASTSTASSPTSRNTTTPLSKTASPPKILSSSKPSTSSQPQSSSGGAAPTTALKRRSFPSAAPGLLKSSAASVPAIVSSSHAKPVLSSTASLARPISSGARVQAHIAKPVTATIPEEDDGTAKFSSSSPQSPQRGGTAAGKPDLKSHLSPGRLAPSKSSSAVTANPLLTRSTTNPLSPPRAAAASPIRAVPPSPVLAASLSEDSQPAKKVDLAFGQNRLKELIKKYQSQAAP